MASWEQKYEDAWVTLPRDPELGGYSGMRIRKSKAISLGVWTEAESKIRSTRTGRPVGTKNYRGRSYGPNDIRRIFGRIDLQIKRGAALGISVTKEAIAEQMLSVVSAQSKFNSYTGNLNDSYVATIVTNRKISGLVYYQARKNSVRYGKHGGRYAELQSPPKHRNFAGFILRSKGGRKNGKRYKSVEYKGGKRLMMKNGKIIRYLHKWEKEGNNPYRSGALGPKGGNFNIGYLNRDSGKIQSGIVIENTAPYSGAVQHRGYNVMKGAAERVAHGGRWGYHATKLVRVAAIKALKDAGIEVR